MATSENRVKPLLVVTLRLLPIYTIVVRLTIA
jgi:hypothetical protein